MEKKQLKKIKSSITNSDSKETDKDVKQEDNEYLKPILKWVGGKTQIIDDLIKTFPDKIDNYHELFTGGGSVLLALLQNNEKNKIIVKNKIYAYDVNETLINMYKNIQKKPNDIIVEIKKLIEDYNSINNDVKVTKLKLIKTDSNKTDSNKTDSNKTDSNKTDSNKTDTKIKKSKTEKNRKPKTLEEAKSSKESYYYWIRNIFNDMSQNEQNQSKGSAYFIFLNKTCFRGMYREGPNGFNVPFGNYKSPEILNDEHLKKISNLIKNVEFIHSDFEDSFKTIKNHDFIYADPPYVPENAKSFVGYTSDGFNLAKHKILFDLCKKHNFVMSNSDTDLVKNSFDDKKKFNIKIISCRRAINSKKPGSKTNEVIIKSL